VSWISVMMTQLTSDTDIALYIAQLISSPYTGRTRIDRLLFLSSQCPQLRIVCSTAAIQLIKSSTTDVTLYNRALTLRNTTAEEGEPLLPKDQRLAADTEWYDRSQKSNQNELEKLDLELRHYQNNLIKESVRVSIEN
jgi:COP9 signalosome complex subunit 1